MTGADLPDDVVKELHTLLVQADCASEGEVAIHNENMQRTEAASRSRRAVRLVKKVMLGIAAVPIMLFAFVGYVVPMFIISVLTNSYRFVAAKVRGEPFKLEWADKGAPGMVGSVGPLKVSIYPNDHLPPHFHIVSHEYDAKFEIETCELLDGNLPARYLKKVRQWHATKVEFLRSYWSTTRPGDRNG